MTRIARLLTATTLAVLPISAFAQTAVTTAPGTTPMTQSAAPATQMSSTAAPVAKTTADTKVAKTSHAKLGTTTPSAPAKTAEPNKS